jgi:hypothetical protein
MLTPIVLDLKDFSVVRRVNIVCYMLLELCIHKLLLYLWHTLILEMICEITRLISLLWVGGTRLCVVLRELMDWPEYISILYLTFQKIFKGGAYFDIESVKRPCRLLASDVRECRHGYWTAER